MNYKSQHVTHFRGRPLKDYTREELYDIVIYLDQMYELACRTVVRNHGQKSERMVYTTVDNER